MKNGTEQVTAEEVCDWMNAFIQTTGKGKQPAPSDIADWININFQRITNAQPNINKDFAQRLLLVRDALVNKDFDEAYHQLYGIASPNYDDYFPWAELEKIAEYKQKEDNK